MYYLANFKQDTKVKSHYRKINGKKIKVDSYSREDRARLKGALIGGTLGSSLGFLAGLPFAPLNPVIPIATSIKGGVSGSIQGGGIGEYLKQRRNIGKKVDGDPSVSQEKKLRRNTNRRIIGGVVGGLTSPFIGIDPISGAILGVSTAQTTRKYKVKEKR